MSSGSGSSRPCLTTPWLDFNTPGDPSNPGPETRSDNAFYFYWVGSGDPVKGRSLELQAKIRQMGLYNVEILESSRVSGLKYDWDNHFGTVALNFKKRVADAPCF